MTVDELAQFDRINEDVDRLKRSIDAFDQVAASEPRAEVAPSVETRTPATIPAVETTTTQPRMTTASEEYRAAFGRMLRTGNDAELRALEIGTASEGGVIVPDSWHDALITARDAVNPMRGLAQVVQTSSGTFNVPTVSAQGAAAWYDEEASISESDDTYANKSFSAYKAATLVKVSNELLSEEAYDLEGYLSREFGRRIGTLEESAFVNGDGSAKPTGAVGGAGTGVTAAGAAAITSDEVLTLHYSLGSQYRPNAVYMAADATVLLLRKLKDSDGQYHWVPGMVAGEPDRLLGRPIYTSAGMPAATTGKKSVLFFDPSYYMIADRAGIDVVRLNELYAATDQTGFKATARTDGQLLLADAAKVLVQA